MSDDIPIDTPLGKTVEEIEANAERSFPGSVRSTARETILALCKALREAEEGLRHAELACTDERLAADALDVQLRRAVDEVERLQAEVARLRDILCEISEPAFDDERLRYVEVQIGREAWEDLKTLRLEDGDRSKAT